MGVPEIFVDGAAEIKIIEGVTRIPLVARRDGEREVVARLAIPITELPDFIQSMVIALTEAAKAIVKPAMQS
jgi:hypothetical protein